MSHACWILAHERCGGCTCICHLDSDSTGARITVAPLTSDPSAAATPRAVACPRRGLPSASAIDAYAAAHTEGGETTDAAP